jgi:pilus assembly protein CpaE
MLKANVVVADLDLAFGTAGLAFNQDPVQGIAEHCSPERVDAVLLDRLLTKCSERLSILAAPVAFDYEISPDACDLVIDIVRQNVPCLAIDLPQRWSPWVKRVLLQADEIVITAIPDLANLRNAKNLIGLMKQGRANDAAPRLVINMLKTPKRPEIPSKEFTVALDIEASQTIEFDSEAFGLAANHGLMLAEFPRRRPCISFANWRCSLRIKRWEMRTRRDHGRAGSLFLHHGKFEADAPRKIGLGPEGLATTPARRARRMRSGVRASCLRGWQPVAPACRGAGSRHTAEPS